MLINAPLSVNAPGKHVELLRAVSDDIKWYTELGGGTAINSVQEFMGYMANTIGKFIKPNYAIFNNPDVIKNLIG